MRWCIHIILLIRLSCCCCCCMLIAAILTTLDSVSKISRRMKSTEIIVRHRSINAIVVNDMGVVVVSIRVATTSVVVNVKNEMKYKLRFCIYLSIILPFQINKYKFLIHDDTKTKEEETENKESVSGSPLHPNKRDN